MRIRFPRTVLLLTLLLILPMGLTSMAATPAHAAVPTSFTVKGSGFGHGVGMSQYGARGMASQGKTATQILQHYYYPAKRITTATNADTSLTVQLVAGRTSVTVTPSSGKLRLRVGKTVVESSRQVTVTRTSAGQVKATANGKSYSASWITVEWQGTRYWKGTQKTTVAVSGTQNGATGTYRHGKLQIRQLGNALNVLGVMKLNSEYLPGIAEMPASWATAALRTQAVAARTYAYRNLGALKPECACNVYDETKSQRFLGWNHENGAGNGPWLTAVNATQTRTGSSSAPTVTQAMVMMHNGALIDAVYSSSSRGTTNSAKDVWGVAEPFLLSRDDSASKLAAAHNPYRSWTVALTQAKVAQAFGLTDVAKVQVTRTAAGLVTSAKATSAKGVTATRTGSQLRKSWSLKSSTFTIAAG